MNNILAREGEYGFVHQINTGIDYSASYVSASIHYRAPDGTVTEKTCDVVSAADGEFGYTAENGFFTKGKWEAMLEIDLGASGIRKLKSPVVFWVGDSGEA